MNYKLIFRRLLLLKIARTRSPLAHQKPHLNIKKVKKYQYKKNKL